MRSSILICDDHPIVRRGLRQLFDSEPDFRVCGEADNVSDAILLIDEQNPDLIVTDLKFPGRDGLELTRLARAHHPNLPVLIVSMHDELLYALRAIGAGARGYVMKWHSDDEIVQAARHLLAGRIYLSPAVREQMRVRSSNGSDPGTPLEKLTDRELEVFLLLGAGYAPRHIADRLSLSVSTVEVYRERLKEKLGMESSPMLTRYAVYWCKDHNVDLEAGP